MLYGVCGFGATLSLLQSVLQNHRISGLLQVLFGAAVFVGCAILGIRGIRGRSGSSFGSMSAQA